VLSLVDRSFVADLLSVVLLFSAALRLEEELLIPLTFELLFTVN
jgi:hypothetical protein